MKYCITFKDLVASELKLRWKKKNQSETLNCDYFVTKSPYHLIKDKSTPKIANNRFYAINLHKGVVSIIIQGAAKIMPFLYK